MHCCKVAGALNSPEWYKSVEEAKEAYECCYFLGTFCERYLPISFFCKSISVMYWAWPTISTISSIKGKGDVFVLYHWGGDSQCSVNSHFPFSVPTKNVILKGINWTQPVHVLGDNPLPSSLWLSFLDEDDKVHVQWELHYSMPFTSPLLPAALHHTVSLSSTSLVAHLSHSMYIDVLPI